MKVKRYILIGDWLHNVHGARYYISAPQLSLLYRLERDECIFADIENPRSLLGLPKLPHLYPQINGDYTLPDFMK